MSGGHFDYFDAMLGDFAEQLARDLVRNNIDNSKVDTFEGPYSYEFPPDVVCFLKEVGEDLLRLNKILHDYDWAVSSDTSLDDFYLKFREGRYRRLMFRKAFRDLMRRQYNAEETD